MHALAITEQGTRLHLEAETLLVSRGRDLLRRVRMGEINQVLLLGQVEISTNALAALARRGVDVVFLSPQGWFRARLAGPKSPQAALRLAQLRRALDPAFCAAVAGRMVMGKVMHQRQILLRAQRRLRDEILSDTLGRMRLLFEECPRQTDLERLRGLEGQAAALYFSQLGKLFLRTDLPFHGRSRRPPRDPVNACLSFGYVMLGSVIETELLRCGLDPMVGFLHQPQHGRASLALDLVEEFRPFIDTLVLRLLNRRQLGPLDFEHRGADVEDILAETSEPGEPEPRESSQETPAPAPSAAIVTGPGSLLANTAETCRGEEGVYLSATGRRIFLCEFFRRLRERLYYAPRQGSFELRDIVREQAYHLARLIEGTDAVYQAFVPA